MRHLDLFSGIGGFALAARMAGGYQTIGFSEIDEYASRVLERNFPGVKNYGDIRNVSYVSADIITGGFPCQPFSVAGKQRGTEDDRHLWPEMLRVITESKPAWVLGENVAGFINMELDTCLSDLEAIGYEAQAVVIPAVGVDAPHRRDRVWIVGYSNRYSKSVGSFDAEASGVRGVECCNVSDANSQRFQKQRRSKSVYEKILQASQRSCRWSPEPRVDRVVDGLPRRVDRLRGLGNAIVPQVAAQILRAMNLVTPNDHSK